MSTPNPHPTQGRRLTRSREDRMIGGVCGGLARYLNVDATLIRVITAVVVLFGAFTPLVAYLVAWVLMPEE